MPGKADIQQRPTKEAGSALVFLGSFNPAIFQPAWFMRYGLIPDEHDAAEIEAVTNQITVFNADWLRVAVQPEKCELIANDEVPSVEALHDLAKGIFELLPHTPVTAFGVNRYAHFAVESEEAWHALGFSLFTAEPWQGVLQNPRMRTVQVEDRAGPNAPTVLTVTVQPSVQFKQAVFVAVNDHYQVDQDAKDCARAIRQLDEVFDESMNHSQEIIERVRSL